MDLTHEEFVHSSSIGQEELSESDFVVSHDGNTVTVTRWMLNIDAPPFWLKNMRDKFPGFEGKVDRWQIITFRFPHRDQHRCRAWPRPGPAHSRGTAARASTASS